MASVGLQTQTASIMNSLVRSAEDKTGVAVLLLKKAVSLDSSTVTTLLASIASPNQQLDIHA